MRGGRRRRARLLRACARLNNLDAKQIARVSLYKFKAISLYVEFLYRLPYQIFIINISLYSRGTYDRFSALIIYRSEFGPLIGDANETIIVSRISRISRIIYFFTSFFYGRARHSTHFVQRIRIILAVVLFRMSFTATRLLYITPTR